MSSIEEFDAELKKVVNDLTIEDKDALARMGLGALLVLAQINPEKDLMEFCMRFWDTEYHVFRFPLGEICPFPEEFAAIGGWPVAAVPAVMPFVLGSKIKFGRSLQLKDSSYFLRENRVDMLRLAQSMGYRRETRVSREVRLRVVLFLLLHRYCFEGFMTPTALGDPRMMLVVEQMEVGRSPACLILGETVIGLDRHFDNPQMPYTGSSKLLLIWLLERLQLIHPPANPATYHAMSYC